MSTVFSVVWYGSTEGSAGRPCLCSLPVGEALHINAPARWLSRTPRDHTSHHRGQRVTHVRSSQKREQLTTRHKVHDHVEVGRVLEGAPEVDDERVLDSHEHLLLVPRVRDLLHPHYLLFAENFDGVVTQVVFAANCRTRS